MNGICSCIGTLPALSRVGGDTTPIVLRLTDRSGRPIYYQEIIGATGTLSIAPTAGVSGTTVTITGTLSEDSTTHGALMTFAPTQNNTIGLSGMYVYQADIALSGGHRIGQGRMEIAPNLAGAST